MEQYINRIINADCMDVLKRLPDKCVDLVLTDPPYGINEKFKGGVNSKLNKFNMIVDKGWDLAPSKELFDEIFRVSKNQIICGGNYFALPAQRQAKNDWNEPKDSSCCFKKKKLKKDLQNKTESGIIVMSTRTKEYDMTNITATAQTLGQWNAFATANGLNTGAESLASYIKLTAGLGRKTTKRLANAARIVECEINAFCNANGIVIQTPAHNAGYGIRINGVLA